MYLPRQPFARHVSNISMIVFAIDELVNCSLYLFEVQPFFALPIHLGYQGVVVAMHSSAFWMSSDYVGSRKFSLVDPGNIRFRQIYTSLRSMLKNSLRVSNFSNWPRISEVTMSAPLLTPRICIQRCLACTTTTTPCGCRLP